MPGQSVDLARLLWRVDRRVGRTVYAVVGQEPSDVDILIGVMDTPDLAAAAVVAHNLYYVSTEIQHRDHDG